MKLEIYSDKKCCESETKVTLRLIKKPGNDHISLVCIDSYGEIANAGHLLQIHPDGTFKREKNVNRHLGFKLDDCGRVVIRDSL